MARELQHELTPHVYEDQVPISTPLPIFPDNIHNVSLNGLL
jgi:hypothetical protein